MAMCLSRPQPAMTCCHSAIERPYFFSMDGKYDAGPVFAHGGDCSVMLCAPAWPAGDEMNPARPLIACGERLHDFRALLMLLKRVANRLAPEGCGGRIRQLLPDGPASTEPVEQGRGGLRPDSAAPVLAHHEKFGDVMRFSSEDQGEASQCALYPKHERLAV